MSPTLAEPPMMARKKIPYAQVRVARDVIELARFVGAYHGKQPGDFISDYLRPRLIELERELLAERSRQLGPATPPPKKGTK